MQSASARGASHIRWDLPIRCCFQGTAQRYLRQNDRGRCSATQVKDGGRRPHGHSFPRLTQRLLIWACEVCSSSQTQQRAACKPWFRNADSATWRTHLRACMHLTNVVRCNLMEPEFGHPSCRVLSKSCLILSAENKGFQALDLVRVLPLSGEQSKSLRASAKDNSPMHVSLQGPSPD